MTRDSEKADILYPFHRKRRDGSDDGDDERRRRRRKGKQERDREKTPSHSLLSSSATICFWNAGLGSLRVKPRRLRQLKAQQTLFNNRHFWPWGQLKCKQGKERKLLRGATDWNANSRTHTHFLSLFLSLKQDYRKLDTRILGKEVQVYWRNGIFGNSWKPLRRKKASTATLSLPSCSFPSSSCFLHLTWTFKSNTCFFSLPRWLFCSRSL